MRPNFCLTSNITVLSTSSASRRPVQTRPLALLRQPNDRNGSRTNIICSKYFFVIIEKSKVDCALPCVFCEHLNLFFNVPSSQCRSKKISLIHFVHVELQEVINAFENAFEICSGTIFKKKGSCTNTGRKIFVRPCNLGLGKGPNCAAWINTIVKCGEMYSLFNFATSIVYISTGVQTVV